MEDTQQDKTNIKLAESYYDEASQSYDNTDYAQALLL